MKIYSFTKRLNATELGLGVTNDAYIAIPSEVNLSNMLQNQKIINPYDRYLGEKYCPIRSDFKYVQTGQNNQERISGLGEYYEKTQAKVGDEILVEAIVTSDGIEYYLDLCHRNAIVFQVNSVNGKRCVDILANDYIESFAEGDDYRLSVSYNGENHELVVKFIEEAKKKKTSPRATRFYDLLIDGNSIVSEYSYQEYIELLTDGMRLSRMKTYTYSLVEIEEGENE